MKNEVTCSAQSILYFEAVRLPLILDIRNSSMLRSGRSTAFVLCSGPHIAAVVLPLSTQCLAAVGLPLCFCVAARISQRSPCRFGVATQLRAAVSLPLVYIVFRSGPWCRHHPLRTSFVILSRSLQTRSTRRTEGDVRSQCQETTACCYWDSACEAGGGHQEVTGLPDR